jgi:hypothetical protein
VLNRSELTDQDFDDAAQLITGMVLAALDIKEHA